MSGIPGYELPSTNLFNFGPELDAIAKNVATLIANQNAFFAGAENQIAAIVNNLNAQIAEINTAFGNLATLLQTTILAATQIATVANQEAEIQILTEIQARLSQAVAVGINPSQTATAPILPPTKSGP